MDHLLERKTNTATRITGTKMVHPQKIIIVGQIPPPYHGSNVMAEICLDALRDSNIEVIFIGRDFSRTLNEVGQFKFRKLIAFLTLLIRLIRQIFSSRPCTTVYFVSVSRVALLIDCSLLSVIRLLRIPYILYFHGKGYTRLYNRTRLSRWILRCIFNSAQGGIVLGENLKPDVRPFMPDVAIRVVPNAIRIDNRPIHQIKEKPDPQAFVNVLYLSHFVPTKGAMDLIKAAERVVKRYSKVKFIFSGGIIDKKFYQDITSLIKERKLFEYVQILGPSYGTFKKELFQSSDIFVFPTCYEYETFGLVNLEAMNYRLPIVTTNIGAIPEVVLDGVCGFIIQPGDVEALAEKICFLIENPGIRRALGDAGYDRLITNYSFNQYREKLFSTIREFCSLKL